MVITIAKSRCRIRESSHYALKIKIASTSSQNKKNWRGFFGRTPPRKCNS